jgi:AcrR family transcriptional regulator
MCCTRATGVTFGVVSPPDAPAPPIEPSLVDAAADVLDAAGIGGLTLSAIAEAAGVSRVTLHRRGASVDDYVVAVLARASDDLRSSLWPILTSSAPAAERLAHALAELCSTCERHSGVMTAMFGVPARELPGRPGRTTSLEFIEPFAKLLADGQADGSLVTDDPLRDATLLANTVCWTYLHMRRAHGWSEPESVRQIVSMATAAYTAH